MERWKGTKCEPGYIHRQKRFQGVMLLVFVAVGAALFLTGYLLTGTRANVFTVLAVLMVLPAAKRVIALVVMLPRQSVGKERYDRLRETVSADVVILADYVFTSPDKIMNLDFVIIEGRDVTGIWSAYESGRTRPGERKAYMKEYLEKGIAGVAEGYRVRIFDSDECFYKQYTGGEHGDARTGTEAVPAEELAEVVKYLKILAV